MKEKSNREYNTQRTVGVWLVYIGFIIGFDDLRLLWLCIFIVIGIHFFGFYISQGKLMLILGIFTVVNSLIGIFLISVPFLLFVVIDGIIKIIIGIKMLLMRRQLNSFL